MDTPAVPVRTTSDSEALKHYAKQVDENATCWLLQASECFTAEVEESTKNEKEAILSKHRDISEHVAALVKENSLRNFDEQLARSEFSIDTKGVEDVKLSAKVEVQKIFERNTDEINRLRSKINKIQLECHDTMSVQQDKIHGFLDPRMVLYNIPVRKQTVADLRRIEISILLRRSEICDIRRNVSYASKTGLSWSVLTNNSMISSNENDFSRNVFVVQSVDEQIANKAEFHNALSDDIADDFPNQISELKPDTSSHALLYPPLSVRTDAQRRIQIALLRCLIRSIAFDFNDNFDKLKKLREQVLFEVERKNERRKDILNYLGKVECIIIPELGNIENDHEAKTESVSQTDDGCKKDDGVSLVMDDASRALVQMMNGTLKSKKKMLLNAPMERERWMIDLTYGEMNNEQRTNFDEFRHQEEELADEIEKYRAALDVELKMNSSEILATVNMFHAKLESIQMLRNNTQTLICTFELYIIHLEHSLINNENQRAICSDIDVKVLNLRGKQKGLSDLVHQIQVEFIKAQKDCNSIIEEGKALERGFRRNIQQYSKDPLDQEMVKILFQLFKKRDHYQPLQVSSRRSWGNCSKDGSQKSSDATSFHKGLSAVINDAVIAAKQHVTKQFAIEDLGNEHAPEVAQVEKSLDRFKSPFLQLNNAPEGISKELWDGLKILRSAKVLQEAAAENAAEAVLGVKKDYDAVKHTLDSCTLQVSKLSNELNEEVQKARIEFSQADVLVQLKQGQDEVTTAINPAYANFILIPSTLINDMNTTILALSEQKITFLTKTQAFRKEIQFMHWCQEYLDLMITVLETASSSFSPVFENGGSAVL